MANNLGENLVLFRIKRAWLLSVTLLVACASGPPAPDRDCVTRDLVIGLDSFPPGGSSTDVGRSRYPIVDNAGRSVFYAEGPTTHDVARFPTIAGAIDFFDNGEGSILRRGRTGALVPSEALVPKSASFRSGIADQQYLVCDESSCIYYARYQEYTTMVAANMGPNMTGEALNRVIMEVDRKLTECLAKPLVK